MSVKKLLLGIVLRLLIAPVWLASVLAVLVMRPIWGGSLSWQDGVLVLRTAPESWFSKSRFLGACWGHAIILSSGAGEDTRRHELRHVEQVEAAAVAGLVLAIVPTFSVHWLLGLLTWAICPALYYGAGMLVAVLRGEHFYEGNHLEEAARNDHH